MRRARRLAVITLLLAFLGSAAALSCGKNDDLIELAIEGVGRAYFTAFEIDSSQDNAELSGSVCIEDLAGLWVLQAAQVSISNLQDTEQLQVEARDVHAEAPGFRISGASARLHAGLLTVTDAAITTCLCEGEPLYRLVGHTATLHLEREGLLLSGGELQVGSLRFALKPEVDLTTLELHELLPPVRLKRIAGNPAAGVLAHGLSLLVPRLELADGITAEFGLLGLDAQHPTSLYGLLHYRSELVNASVGLARDGPQADFSVRQPLNDWLDATFAVHNRHYRSQHYLHEGLLRLDAALPVREAAGGGRFSAGASLLLAASSQQFGGNLISGPRVRLGMHGAHTFPEREFGRFSVAFEAAGTFYGGGRSQYALNLKPAWQLRRGPVTFSAAFDWRGTNSASPFSTKLDRLTPVSRATLAASWQDALSATTTASASLGVSYSFLQFSSGERQGFENLSAGLRFTSQVGEWTLTPGVQLQFAGLLDPRLPAQRKAFIEGAFQAVRGELELGLLGRWHTGGKQHGLEILETSVAFPVRFEHGQVIPFLGLDVAPFLTGAGAPQLSGHGLEVQLDTCCALLEFGYRHHGGETVTSFGATFVRQR